MAVQTTEEFKNGGATSYAITIEYLKTSDIKVRIDGALQTYVASGPSTGEYTVSGTTVTLGATAAAGTGNVHIYRETDVNTPAAVFAVGSAIKASELNAIHDMGRFAAVEHRNKIITADIKEGQVTSTEIKDGSILNADINASAAIDNTKIADGLLKSGITVNSDNIVDGSIVNADVSNSAAISGSKLADDSIPMTKLLGGALPGDITVSTTNIEANTIVDSDINASAAISHSKLNLDIVNSDINSGANIAGSKLANDSVDLTKLGGGPLPTDITVAASNIVDGTIGNIEINNAAAIEFSKLETGNLPSQITVNSSNIVDGSIVDGDINSSANINGSKLLNDSVSLDKLGSGALPNDITVSDTNINTGSLDNRYYTETELDAGQLDNRYFTETELTSGGLIDSRYYTETELDAGQLDNRYFTETELNNGQLNNQYYTEAELNGGQLDTRYFSESEILSGAADSRYYTETELDAGQLDNRYYTETELNAGQLDNRYYTETEAEALFLRQDSSETIASGVAWSNTDAKVATTAAINARIIDLIDDVGGFTTIATELLFPNTNPQGTTGQAAILSIGALSQAYTPSGTTVTVANGTVGNSTVTITGVPSVLPQGFGILVESTTTLNTYTFHRLVPKATEITTVASNITNIVNAGANLADINNFSDKYIIAASAPSTRNDGSGLQEGDLWYDSSNDNLLVYTGAAFAIITPSQSVLNDVAVVSGAITYQEDLGLITDAASTGNSNGSLDIVADALEDEITFAITVASGKYYIDGVQAPALNLYKGWTYTFDVSDGSNGSHPLRFYCDDGSYQTGVTITGTQGQAGAKVQIVVPETQKAGLRYYCTNHSGMGNTITVKDDPIKTVSDNITNILAAANNNANVTAVAGNATNINSAVANASNINAAVANASNINAAVANASNITAVADNETNINAVQANQSNINAVQSNASNINTVSGINANVTTVAGISANVTAVAGNATNINAVKNNSTNINAVNANSSNINTVAGNNTNVTTVAGKATEITRLGTADAVADMNTLGTTAIVSDMDTLADISSNITTVAGISANVTTVAGNNANVTAVAGNNSNITAVANNSSNINSAVSNASNINSAVSNASNINAVVSNATNINTVAGNVTDVNNFADQYQIASSAPSTDGSGNSLAVGDLYFNTSANELRIWNGSQWQGGVTATGALSQVSGSVFTGDNRYNDNIKVKFGADSDLQIFHNTTDSVINASGTGNLKLQDVGNTKLEITSTGISTTGNIGVTGTVDGRDVATDGTKLDGIESAATADQTASEIVALISGQTIAPNAITTTNLTLDFGTL